MAIIGNKGYNAKDILSKVAVGDMGVVQDEMAGKTVSSQTQNTFKDLSKVNKDLEKAVSDITTSINKASNSLNKFDDNTKKISQTTSNLSKRLVTLDDVVRKLPGIMRKANTQMINLGSNLLRLNSDLRKIKFSNVNITSGGASGATPGSISFNKNSVQSASVGSSDGFFKSKTTRTDLMSTDGLGKEDLAIAKKYNAMVAMGGENSLTEGGTRLLKDATVSSALNSGSLHNITEQWGKMGSHLAPMVNMLSGMEEEHSGGKPLDVTHKVALLRTVSGLNEEGFNQVTSGNITDKYLKEMVTILKDIMRKGSLSQGESDKLSEAVSKSRNSVGRFSGLSAPYTAFGADILSKTVTESKQWLINAPDTLDGVMNRKSSMIHTISNLVGQGVGIAAGAATASTGVGLPAAGVAYLGASTLTSSFLDASADAITKHSNTKQVVKGMYGITPEGFEANLSPSDIYQMGYSGNLQMRDKGSMYDYTLGIAGLQKSRTELNTFGDFGLSNKSQQQLVTQMAVNNRFSGGMSMADLRDNATRRGMSMGQSVGMQSDLTNVTEYRFGDKSVRNGLEDDYLSALNKNMQGAYMGYMSDGFVGRIQSDVMSKAAFGEDYSSVLKDIGEGGEKSDKLMKNLQSFTGAGSREEAVQMSKTIFAGDSAMLALLNKVGGGDTGKTQIELTTEGIDIIKDILKVLQENDFKEYPVGQIVMTRSGYPAYSNKSNASI